VSDAARWNQRFSATEYIFGTGPNEFLASKAGLLRPGQRALCVADGEGRNSVWLAECGLEVVAFDISPVGVEKARRLAAARGVKVAFEVADGPPEPSTSWPRSSCSSPTRRRAASCSSESCVR
jgi:2-polyprenyl-3-methyl-5-hydroxy-6-metoxy-1,4-benzoquinol methylase